MIDFRKEGRGARNGIRTRDLNLGKVALYQLSYSRIQDLQSRKKDAESQPFFVVTDSVSADAWSLHLFPKTSWRLTRLAGNASGTLRIALSDERQISL